MKIQLFFDGGCTPRNPGGTGTWAYVIKGLTEADVEGYGALQASPKMTNNVAEYVALGKGLRFLADYQSTDAAKVLTSLEIRGDSKLVVNQLTEEWKCNKEHLQKLRARCWELLEQIKCSWTTEWIPREENSRADALGHKAYTEATGQPYPDTINGRRI